MRRRVLVLNQDYNPLAICSTQRAFLLVFLNKAELVSKTDGQFLRTVTQTFPKPAVIRILRYISVPYKGVELSRQNIFKRDGFSCQYCGTNGNLTLDHLIPRSMGGKSTWNNLVTACKTCNARKGNNLPEEVGFSLTRKPFKPSFILFIRDFSGFIQDEWKPFLDYSLKAG